MNLPDSLSHYEILGRIGAGGMGEVYRARDTKLDREVAIKILPPELASNPELAHRFAREAKAIASLNHPHIITIHSVEEADGIHFLTMELIQGESLDALLPAEGMPLADLLRFAVPLCDAVAAAHEQGIVHRDLKPANVMVDAKGRIKVLDFGLAKRTRAPGSSGETETQTLVTVHGEGRVMGTVRYMSPEQAQGKELGPSSDVFSLGIMLYEMATGGNPFGGDSSMEILSSIIKDDPPPLEKTQPRLPAEFSRILRRALAKDPERRYETALGLRNDLQALAEDLADGKVRRNFPRPRISPGRLAIPALAVVALAVLLIVNPLQFGSGAHACDLEAVPGRRVVLLPFTYRGSPEFERLGSEIPELLATRLNGISGISAAAPASYADCWVDSRSLSAVGEGTQVWMEEHHARLVVVGGITEVSGRLRVDLGFRYHDPDVQTWFEESSITLDEASDVLPMVNEVGLEILRHLLREPGDDLARDALAAGTSFEALAAFLNEYWAFFIGLEFRYRDFGKAASLDSTMALAYYLESMRADMLGMGDDVIGDLVAKARRHADRLPAYSRLLVESAQHEFDRDVDEAEALLVRAINTYPERTTALLRLGNLHYQHNSSRGRSMVESGREFELVQEMDPRNRIPEVALQWIYLLQGNDDAIRVMFRDMPSPERESLLAFTSGTQDERDSLMAKVDYCGRGLDGGYTLRTLTYRDNHRNAIELLEAQVCPEAAEENRAWATLTLAHLTAGLGRWATAREWFDAVPPTFRSFRLEYESLALSLPFVPGDEERIREQLALLEEWHPLDEPSRVDPQMEGIFRQRFDAHVFLHEHLRRYCQAVLHTRLGDPAEARAALRHLGELPVEPEYREFIEDLQAMGEARIAFARGDFAGALAQFEKVHRYRYLVGHYSAFFQRSDARYLRALCLAELGRHREAVGWFDAADEGVEFLGIYTAFGHLGQAGSYEALGMREDAAEHYRRFLRLMEGCDPGYAEQVEEAAGRLQRLEGVS